MNKVRLTISKDTVFVLENPKAAPFAREQMKPHAVKKIARELAKLREDITSLISILEIRKEDQ